MANTKSLPHKKRKVAKRKARARRKVAWAALTRAQRREFKKGDDKSLNKFIASIKPKEPEVPKEVPEAEVAETTEATEGEATSETAAE